MIFTFFYCYCWFCRAALRIHTGSNLRTQIWVDKWLLAKLTLKAKAKAKSYNRIPSFEKAPQRFRAVSESRSGLKVWGEDHLWSARPWRRPAPLYHLWPHLQSSSQNQNHDTENSFQFGSGFIFCVRWVQIQFIRLFQSSRTRVLPPTGEGPLRLT